ncbi:reverse transcriptase domain-containing protein [Urbifossiella limnaea]|uniref:Reverse transcriptase (RNA-dependent DNA polymerase) n=1 Tax=Urbifossiella limnaea TaxID=2528023 RepID=A0A517XV55_9BACT|nr:reverse transcriptase domain-containing protein [Urbifossiella limnaea]QDU21377.1 Reverse transcriptase (RNA-dependent DNA polymerase) [Urbifossiella limnaea]
MPPHGHTTGNITPATVTVRTAGAVAAITPPLAGLSLLTTREVVAAADGSPVRLKWVTRPLFAPADDLAGTPCLAGPRPLAALAAEFVRAGGGRVRMPAPAPWSPAALDPGLCPDAGVIGAVAREPYLTVRYDRRVVDPVWLAVQIPLAFAAKSVAVVGKTVGQVDAFVALARDAGLDVTTFTGPRGRELPRTRVAVSTFEGLAHDDALLARREVVVVLDVLEGLEKRALRAVECASPGRLVGLLADTAAVPPADLDRLMRVYGLAEVRVGRHGLTDRAVVYGAVPYRGTRLAIGLPPGKVKDIGVWANAGRNRQIADIAAALHTGDHRAVTRLVPKSLRRRLPPSGRRAKTGYHVAVVVENAEHGNRVLSLLPGWAGAGRGLCPLPAPGRTGLGWGEPVGGEPAAVVCTFGGLKEVPLGEYDVVIRADGGTGPLPRAADFGSADSTAPELVFIDIDDRFHRGLQRNGRSRRAAYRRLGWRSIAEPAGSDQLRRYLARHPDGDAIRGTLAATKLVGGDSTTTDADADADDTTAQAEPIVVALLQPSTAQLTPPTGRPRRLPPNRLSGYSRHSRLRPKNEARRVLEGRNGYLPLVDEIVGTDNLYAVLLDMTGSGAGWGAGEDGIGLYDLSPREWVGHLRGLSVRVLDGGYRPEPTRLVKVPKPDGRFRPIEVGSVLDRVLAGALNRALAPHLDPHFLGGSYGFRSAGSAAPPDLRRDHWDALAALKAYVDYTGITNIVDDDVKQAFPSVCHDLLLADIEAMLATALPKNYDPAPLLNLVEAIVRGRDPRHHRKEGVGITQGCPLSPLLLNTHLHPRHDLAVDREGALIPFWTRYADNVAYLVRSETDGVEALGLVRQLLGQVGLDLKGTTAGPSTPTDLRVRPVELLGFTLQVRDRKVVPDIPDDAWTDLAAALQDAHRADDPGTQARSILCGWAAACGPAVENRLEAVHQTILSTARENGFDGAISPEKLSERLRGSRNRWRGKLERAARQGRESREG